MHNPNCLFLQNFYVVKGKILFWEETDLFLLVGFCSIFLLLNIAHIGHFFVGR